MRIQAAFVLALALLLSGCAKPETQVVGKWTFDTASMGSGDPKTDAIAKSFGSSMTMEFKADKTFTGPMMEGTYEVNGHKITMRTTKVMGMDVSKMPGADASAKKPDEATLSDDGKTITIPAGAGKPVKLIKAAS